MPKSKQASLLEAPKKKGTDMVNHKTLLYANPNIDLSVSASMLQKSCRRGDIELATKAAFLLVEKFPFYLWRRLATIASEDVGNADPQAAILISALYSSWVNSRQKDSNFRGRTLISQATTYLCRTVKNRECDHLTMLLGAQLDQKEPIEIPDWVWDKHTLFGKKILGRSNLHFFTEGAFLQNESGKDDFKQKCIEYLKKIGKYN